MGRPKGRIGNRMSAASTSPLSDLRAHVSLLPSGWIDQSPTSLNKVRLIKIQEQSSSSQPLVITHCLTIENDLSWKIYTQ